MKKRLLAHSNEEVDKLKQQVTVLATEDAKKIVDKARVEAEAESAEITKQAEKSIAGIKKNIDSSFDKAVDIIVRTVLGESPPTPAPKSDKPASKAKKYAEQG